MKKYLAILLALILMPGVALAQNQINLNTQVKGKLPLANQTAGYNSIIYAVDHGAVCDESTDDTTAIRASITLAAASAPSVVQLPPFKACKVTGTLTLPDGVTLRAAGTMRSGLLVATANLNPVIAVTGSNVQIQNMHIYADGAGANTSGSVITVAPSSINDIIRDVIIDGACNALDVSGSYHVIQDVRINYARGTGCTASMIGRQTTGGNSVDIKYERVIVTPDPASRPDNCLVVFDSGGLFVNKIDNQLCTTGMRVLPGANQSVIWTTVSDSYLGDTNPQQGFVIDTAHATGKVQGFSCTQCWSSSSQNNDGVTVQNTGGGVVTGINFVNLRAIANFNNAFTIGANVTDIKVSDSFLCAYNGTGVSAANGASKFSVTTSEINPTCEGVAGFTGQYGVYLGGSNADVTLDKLNLVGNTVAQIAGVPTGSSFIGNITNISASTATIASASTITLNAVVPNWTVSGTTPVSTISGAWAGRAVTLITTGGSVAFMPGDNICTPFASTANMPVSAFYLGSCWYLSNTSNITLPSDNCTTDSVAMIAAAFANSTGAVRLNGCYRASSTVIVPSGRELVGENTAFSNPVPGNGTKIVCDLGVSPCVQIGNGSNNYSTTASGLLVTRAAGTPGSTTVGVKVLHGQAINLRDIMSTSHGVCYLLQSDAPFGITFFADHINSGACVDAHIVFDSWPEARITNSRFGQNGAGDYAANTYIRTKGGYPGTADGPNTITFVNDQFNQGGNTIAHFWEFVNLNGTVPTTDATNFRVASSHVEHVNGALFKSDATWNYVNRVGIINTEFNTPSASFFDINTATSLLEWDLTGNNIYVADFTWGPSNVIDEFTWTGGTIHAPVVLNLGSSSNMTMTGVSHQGSTTLSGTPLQFSSIGEKYTSGSFINNTTSGKITVLNPTTGLSVQGTDAGTAATMTLKSFGTGTPAKTVRSYGGKLEVVNSAFSAVIAYLTDAGLWNAQSYSVNGTAGVTCSGAPTGSYAVTNGIVTHC